MQGLTEASYENSVIELFQNMGYTHVYGPDVDTRDFYSPLYMEILEDYIHRLNKDKSEDAIQDALYKLKNIDNSDLLQRNITFMDYLQNGIPARYMENGEHRSTIIYLVDYENPNNNSFIVANQWTFIEPY